MNTFAKRVEKRLKRQEEFQKRKESLNANAVKLSYEDLVSVMSRSLELVSTQQTKRKNDASI